MLQFLTRLQIKCFRDTLYSWKIHYTDTYTYITTTLINSIRKINNKVKNSLIKSSALIKRSLKMKKSNTALYLYAVGSLSSLRWCFFLCTKIINNYATYFYFSKLINELAGVNKVVEKKSKLERAFFLPPAIAFFTFMPSFFPHFIKLQSAKIIFHHSYDNSK